MVSSTPRPHFTPGKDPVPILQEAGWAPGLVWTGGKSRPHRDSIPDLPARSSVAIPTELPGPHKFIYNVFMMTDIMMLENVAQRHVCTHVCMYVHICTCTTCITLLRYAADTQRLIYALCVPVLCVPQEHTQTICTHSLAVTHTSSPCFQSA